MDDKTLSETTGICKKSGSAIEKAIDCKRVAVMILGLEVPHTHIHLVPINKEGDMNLSNPKLKLEAEEMTEIAAKLREKF